MNFTKYNSQNDTTLMSGTAVTILKNYIENNNNNQSSKSRNLWGCYDNGVEDLNGSMEIEGDVVITPNEEDGEGGNLSVDGECYATELYLNYPTKEDEKTNVADLFQENKADITSLKTTTFSHNQRLKALEENSGNGHSNCIVDKNMQFEGMATNTNVNAGFIMENGDYTLEISPKYITASSGTTYALPTIPITGVKTKSINFSTELQNTIMIDQNNRYTFNTTHSINFTDTKGAGNLCINSLNLYESLVSQDYEVTDINYTLTLTISDSFGKSDTRTFNNPIAINSQIFKFSFDCLYSPTLTLTLSINGSCTITKTTSKPTLITSHTLQFNGNLSYEYPSDNPIISDGDGTNFITPNGMLYNFGTNKTFYVGEDYCLIKYGNYGIRISSTGIEWIEPL